VAGGIAAGSVALIAAGLVLAYVDRHPLPAGVTSWDLADVFQNVVNLGVPVLGFALASRRPENPMGWLFLAAGLALLCLWVALGTAVLKYRLYDIDIVISKAVLYGSLAVFITAVYAALVVGVGTLAGNQRSPLLAALAAAVVAVAFQPARQRAGRLANRVVYGKRATPYQVLSQFAQRIGATYASQDVLPQMAQIVAAGTGPAGSCT
jgi:hypothetical protein